MNKSGKQVVLDENGILQSWQAGGYADNVDESNPLTLYVYMPDRTLSVYEGKLNFRLLPFRSYSATTESGGSSVVTSAGGGGTSTTSGSGGGTSRSTSSGGGTSTTSAAGGDHRHLMFVDGGIGSGSSPKRAFTGFGSAVFYNIETSSPGDIWTAGSSGNHVHSFQVQSHQHDFSTPNHIHSISLNPHSHSVSLPNHNHSIAHGIYTSTIATGVGVIINGIDRTKQLGGKFNSSQANLDIGDYLEIGRWNEIELTSDRLGRLDASVFVQALMSFS